MLQSENVGGAWDVFSILFMAGLIWATRLRTRKRYTYTQKKLVETAFIYIYKASLDTRPLRFFSHFGLDYSR